MANSDQSDLMNRLLAEAADAVIHPKAPHSTPHQQEAPHQSWHYTQAPHQPQPSQQPHQDNPIEFRRGDHKDARPAQQWLVDAGIMPALNERGKSNVDGDFGPATERYVKQFQHKAGLPETGILRAEDMNALRGMAERAKAQTQAQAHGKENAMPPGVAEATALTQAVFNHGGVFVKQPDGTNRAVLVNDPVPTLENGHFVTPLTTPNLKAPAPNQGKTAAGR